MAAALTFGCAFGCPSRPKVVVYDLAARAAIAELESERAIVLFGTPASEPHLADGFFRESARPGTEGFVWAREDCQISFTWPAPAPRAAVLDLEPYHGVANQKAQVLLNEQPIGSIDVDARRRQRFDLPVNAQRAGENRIKLVFSGTASPQTAEKGSDDERQLAAKLYNIVVGAADDPTLLDLLGRDAPKPLGVSDDGGAPRLTQMGRSSLRYAVWLPKTAELRLTPDIDAAARSNGARVSFRVTIEESAGRERELWAVTLDAREKQAPVEVVIPLQTTAADGIVRLGLHVSGAGDGDRFAWGAWKAPRVIADRAVDLLAPPTFTDEEQRKGEAIRGALGNVNVVFIILDAARAQEFGAYGYPRATTPNIDALAREGVVFENAFSPAAYTLAAMSSVWTSQYPDRHHDAASFGARLPADKLTLAELLSAQGVYSAGFVANSMAGGVKGLDRGFSEFHEVYKTYGSAADSFRAVLPAWFKANRDKRFFAYVHFKEPHCPYDPPPPFDTQFGADGPIPKADRVCPDEGPQVDPKDIFKAANRGVRPLTSDEREHLVRLYDGNLAFADQEVGKIRDVLQAEGLWDRTVLIVAADHGEGLYEHGWIGHNVHLFDEFIHIPLIVRFPGGRGPAGKRVKEMVDLLDVGPTIADVFGVLGKGGSKDQFQGRSLFPVIAGAPGKAAILSRTVRDRPWYALRTPRDKFLYHSGTGEEQLFDLVRDPHEQEDRRAQEPLKTAYYREAVRAVIARLATRGTHTRVGDKIPCDQCENMKSMGYLPSDTKCAPPACI